MTRNIRQSVMAGLFIAFVSGCAGANIPGMPGDLASALPGASPTPKPVTKEECAAASPASSPDTGGSALGAYANQLLPQGWNNAYKTEAAITEAIAKWDVNANATAEEKNRWACFQKFYQGTTAAYIKLKAAAKPATPASPAAAASPATAASPAATK